MPIDERVLFYLQHRDQIEEWAALRAEAAPTIEAALRSAAESLLSGSGPRAEARDGQGWERIGLPVDGLRAEFADTLVTIQWSHSQLLTLGGASWPFLAIKTPQRNTKDHWFLAVKTMTETVSARHGLTRSENGFPWWGYLPMRDRGLDIDKYANECVHRLVDAWSELAPVIAEVRP